MRERLIRFLNSERLTSVELAERISVSPASISHLLSGRNKPGFDFLVKLFEQYPGLNPEWIILGRGEMYHTDTPRSTIERNDLLSSTAKPTDKVINVKDNDRTEGLPFQERYIPSANDIVNKAEAPPVSAYLADNNANTVIDSVITFFADGTFTQYVPRDKK